MHVSLEPGDLLSYPCRYWDDARQPTVWTYWRDSPGSAATAATCPGYLHAAELRLRNSELTESVAT